MNDIMLLWQLPANTCTCLSLIRLATQHSNWARHHPSMYIHVPCGRSLHPLTIIARAAMPRQTIVCTNPPALVHGGAQRHRRRRAATWPPPTHSDAVASASSFSLRAGPEHAGRVVVAARQQHGPVRAQANVLRVMYRRRGGAREAQGRGRAGGVVFRSRAEACVHADGADGEFRGGWGWVGPHPCSPRLPRCSVARACRRRCMRYVP